MDPLPTVSDDILLAILTHKSLRVEDAPKNEIYGDGERLAELGATVLETAVKYFLFTSRPMLDAKTITSRREEILSDETVEEWLDRCGLKGGHQCAPDIVDPLSGPEGIRFLFNSYVGGVFVESGLQAVQDWISRLIDPDSEPPALPGQSKDKASSDNKTDNDTQRSPSLPPPDGTLPPPDGTLPPPDGTLPPPPVLPQFNHVASIRALTVEWPSSSSGADHSLKWIVKCMINGVEKGTGAGRNRKEAKEEAAQRAWKAMNFSKQSKNNNPTSQTNKPTSQAQPSSTSLPTHLNLSGQVSQQSVGFLALFNQMAAQRRLSLQWPAAMSGEAHAVNWSVQCLVNGEMKGQGVAHGKQTAKEEAAKQALQVLGWLGVGKDT